MQGNIRRPWRPAPRMGLVKSEKILGLPGNLVWGGTGFAAGLGGSVVVDALVKDTPVPATILGPLAVSLIGGLLFWNAKQPHRAIPWAVGAAVPAAVQMIYGALFPARAAA
jgi:hypothetical protein